MTFSFLAVTPPFELPRHIDTFIPFISLNMPGTRQYLNGNVDRTESLESISCELIQSPSLHCICYIISKLISLKVLID